MPEGLLRVFSRGPPGWASGESVCVEYVCVCVFVCFYNENKSAHAWFARGAPEPEAQTLARGTGSSLRIFSMSSRHLQKMSPIEVQVWCSKSSPFSVAIFNFFARPMA